MAMTGILKPVTALLLTTAVLMLGGGLQGVLLPLRAGLEGFSDIQIGLVGSAYYLGLLVGCLVAPGVIARVGHIRAYAAFSAVASMTPLIHAMTGDVVVWIGVRLISGAAFAGILLVIESWLSAAAEHETRGRVLGAYTLIHLTVIMAGMQLISLHSPAGFELFSLVAVLFSLAALPIALTATIAPAPPKRARLRLGWLFIISPVAWLAALLTGMTNGAFWMMVPVFARDAGFSAAGIALFVATAVLAGAVAQWPIGGLSDRFGRRNFLTVTGLTSAVAGLGLIITAPHDVTALFILIALFGAANFPIYTLALAHANDLVSKRRAVEVSSGLLLVFSAGAVTGPLAAALAMAAFGPGALFMMTALAHLAIAAVVTARVQLRPRLPQRHREDYVVMPRTTPAVYELDPRADPDAPVPAPAPPTTASVARPVTPG